MAGLGWLGTSGVSNMSSMPTPPPLWNVNSGQMMDFSNVSILMAMNDYVFQGKDAIDTKTAMKRIEKYRKAHPDESDCLDKMYKKAYSK